MNLLENKRIIILGDRDGISASTIEECARSVPGASVIYSATEFFSTIMDLENQTRIRALAEAGGVSDMLLLLGTGDKAATRLAAETVTTGDPGKKGALAGLALQLPFLHVLEDAFHSAVGENIWEEHLQAYANVLDCEAIFSELRGIREPH